MSAERYFTAIFCDDVRREEGNKLSYLGVYSGNLLMPAFPVVLPKLCFAMTMTSVASRPITSLLFRLMRNDEIVAESEIPSDALSQIARSAPEFATDEHLISVSGMFQLFPLQLSEKCVFRARALCDGEEFKGGSLMIDTISTRANS